MVVEYKMREAAGGKGTKMNTLKLIINLGLINMKEFK